MSYSSTRFLLALVVLTNAMVQAQAGDPSQTGNAVPASPSRSRSSQRSGNAGSVTGVVKDNTGGVIPGATVALSNSSSIVDKVQSNGDGSYTFRGVAPGVYTISVTYSGLQQQGITAVTVGSGQSASRDLTMKLAAQRQEVTVTDSPVNAVSTDPSNNATALVLRQEDLDALPDDPDDLQADLQALAGPSAGPGGNQIYIDGFTGGRLPPKASIREIRINSNPFSAEFDKLGYGRIQVFTKPGSDRFHGQGYYNISDGLWNSRNPFSTVNPPFRAQLFGGNVSGPLGKHASFFIDAERRQIDDNGIIVASIPTADFLTTRQFGTAAAPNYYPTPQRRTTVSPRVDYQLNANNTLSFRYSFLQNDRLVTGISGFTLPATQIGNIDYGGSGYGLLANEHTVQIVETSVLSPRAVNETHFQFDRERQTYSSQSDAPKLFVGQAFVVGGSGYSAPGYPGSYDLANNYELQNYTSLTLGTHTTKFGIRIRASVLDNSTPYNFNGIYQFLGGTFPLLDSNLQPLPGQSTQLSSVDQYLLTARLLATGLSAPQVAALGYGPSKYTVSAGNPYIGVNQMDFGPFIQDDWRARPNLTVSLGLRWESQTNIYDHSDWAPRLGFAWSPGGKGTGGRAKTVIRGGWGFFYDRFQLLNVENAERYLSGSPLTSYTLNRPQTFDPTFTNPLPLSLLSASSGQVYQIDHALQSPRLMQTAIGVERQLFKRTTLSVNFTNSRGIHEFRTVDINAPVPIEGALPPGTPAAAGGTLPTIRPYGNVGDIYDYQSDGIFKQTQVLVNMNTTVGKVLTLFTRYTYSNAHSDTDGLGTLPSNPYDYAADYGRSILDVKNSLFVGGSITPRWGLRFSPFVVLHSGTPFNITTGTDLYLQGNGSPTARPSVMSTAGPDTVNTPFGFLNPYPVVGEPVIQRNAGTSAGFIGVNLRVSKTFGFGTTKFQGTSGGASANGGGGYGGGGGGGRGGGGFGGGGGRGGGGGGETSNHRYNLTLSVNARNILNHENLNTFNGSITSPYFLQPTGITGGYGAEATASNQRRLDLQLRFSF